MRAFSNPADDTGGHIGGESCAVSVQDSSGLLVSSVASEEEDPPPNSFFKGNNGGSSLSCASETTSGLLRANRGGTETCVESDYLWNRSHSDTELDEEHDANNDEDGVNVGNDIPGGGFAAASPEPGLVMPAELDIGQIEDMDDGDVVAADWLEVTHALLDEGDKSGQPGR